MNISIKQFKLNVEEFLEYVENEDSIIIEKNGKAIAKLSSPIRKKRAALYNLIGIAEGDCSLEDAKDERLSRQ